MAGGEEWISLLSHRYYRNIILSKNTKKEQKIQVFVVVHVQNVVEREINIVRTSKQLTII